ncbi:MAG: polysaccharide biosynthesis protein [Erysipelotrichaceae bacterium]|nr:polysaccharide biosynthesis protein [Erysipelotrichaceae bacterium]
MSSSNKHPLITGTVILTLAGLASRVIGFFYRIFLSRTIGAEGLGIYQLIFPIYALCFALVAAGIQTGISRCCAAAFAAENPQKARIYFSSGFCFSFLFSLLAAFFLHRYAGFLSLHILKEMRCEPLLKLISYSIPLGTVHTCISAWYFAKKQAQIPSAAQLLEQVVRVFASYMLYLIFLEKGIAPTPILAVAGILAGELASSLFSSICILFQFRKPKVPVSAEHFRFSCTKELLALSLPLTASRVLLTLFQSTEAILIPSRLKMYGLTSTQALSIYGILTGMALPFILFPSAITNSVSTMLLPTIAGEQAKGNSRKIVDATEKTIKYCLLLGIFAGGIFFFFGPALGTLIFHTPDAGTFMRILSFLCPFLYLTATLTSILNGLGHTTLTFLQNLTSITIRILFILQLVPRFGITAYLWSMLASQLASTLLNMYFLRQKLPLTFYPYQWIILPFLALLLSCGTGLFIYHLCSTYNLLPPIFHLLSALLTSALTYLTTLILMNLLRPRSFPLSH